MACSICNDEKHILDSQGRWVRCSCLEKELFQMRALHAGIQFSEEELTEARIKSDYPHVTIDQKIMDDAVNKLCSIFKSGKLPVEVYCFQGTPLGPKDQIVQMMLLEAVRGGMSINQCNMEQLISSQFEKERVSLENEFTRARIFCLNFGNEIQYNIGTSFLQDIFRLSTIHRSNYLLLHTNLRWDDIEFKYGHYVQNMFVRSSGANKKEKRAIFSCVEEG